MKIFAKRKRKAVEPSDGGEKDRIFKSDKDAEELLKREPSTWNAKERRLMKRYKERKPDSSTEEKPEEKEEVDDTPSIVENEEEEKPVSDENEETEEPLPTEPQGDVKEGDASVNETKEEADISEGDNTAIDSKLQKLLEKLSSKPRRKLTRSLERGGNVEEVRAEAEALLGIKKQAEETSEEPKKKRRRSKGPADLSSMTPDERLRREDQRRLQKEAAERRASGDQSKHKHPLNSERRRANRRKPSHAKPQHTKKAKPFDENEHNSSGFHMRRITKEDAQAARA